ncbi:MAG: prolipoprotein diacylglyceryl transferase [Cyclobacteriaceae bacterium]
MISYIIWNANPEILNIGSFSLRWYGVLFALGFLLSQQILYYIYKKEGKDPKDIDTLTIYMVIATIVGARLGHIIFYQPEIIWENPLGIFLPFEFSPEFRFTGLQGLASHGAAIGILFALWLYSRKKLPGQNYMQVLDRIVIVVALTGCLIRFGNFFNSEIIGKPTNGPAGVVFISRPAQAITSDQFGPSLVESLTIAKNDSLPKGVNGRVPINLYIFFKPEVQEMGAKQFLRSGVKYYLSRLGEYVYEPTTHELKYELYQEKSGSLVAKVSTFGIARHPAQLYESISCLLLFALLFWIWSIKKEKTQTGIIFGIFMIVLWSLRFFYEFLKENQVAFEDDLALNMGQILSIPLVIVGILIIVWAKRNPSVLEK